ncbi:hypothetical protein AMECASPLE_011289, partial [Ameca splendens]
ERDAERRRQLRERARQLIAEARSGVKISDMSLLDPTNMERSKGSPAGFAGDVLGKLRSLEGEDVDGEKSKDEEQSRAEEEKPHFRDGAPDSLDAALSASAHVTNQLPQEALPTTSSAQGYLELTNPASELTSLGTNSKHVDLKLKKLAETSPRGVTSPSSPSSTSSSSSPTTSSASPLSPAGLEVTGQTKSSSRHPHEDYTIEARDVARYGGAGVPPWRAPGCWVAPRGTRPGQARRRDARPSPSMPTTCRGEP